LVKIFSFLGWHC